ncbi:MAG: tetratricopeptide repeat protein, partial [Longimicrobiales bacterium]
MKSVAKLKDEARKNEQAEEWEQAIEAYDEVLRVTDNAEAELPLYNRIGDLYVRMGRPADAVAYYERAADHYAEAGLYNNAIALCNKALRYVPNRLELLRKLGQFSGAQGFLTDARRWYLEYAERQMKNGELDDAFTALEDFATVYEDAEIRELMGRQLRAHNRIGPAVVALKRAHTLRVQAGENAAAAALKEEILKLMPDAFSVDTDALAAARVATPSSARERVELPGYADPLPAPTAPVAAHSAASAAAEMPATTREPAPAAEPQTETPAAQDDAFDEPQAEAAGIDFDQDLAELELDRALGYETAPPVEAPVFDAVDPATASTTAADEIETEPEFEPPEPTGTQESEFSEVEGFEPEDNAFTIDLPPLDLPPLDLPPLDLPIVPESEPLPFLTFDDPVTASG